MRNDLDPDSRGRIEITRKFRLTVPRGAPVGGASKTRSVRLPAQEGRDVEQILVDQSTAAALSRIKP